MIQMSKWQIPMPSFRSRDFVVIWIWEVTAIENRQMWNMRGSSVCAPKSENCHPNAMIAKFTPIRWSWTSSVVSCTIEHRNNDRNTHTLLDRMWSKDYEKFVVRFWIILLLHPNNFRLMQTPEKIISMSIFSMEIITIKSELNKQLMM